MFRLTHPVVILTALLWLPLMGCGEDPPPKAQHPAPPSARQPAVPPPVTTITPQPATVSPSPPALEQRPKAWPYLSKEYNLPVAENLLARNFVLIFDGSGSMRDKGCSGEMAKIDAAKIAVRQWFAALPADANLGLVTFHANSNGLTVLDMATGSRKRFVEAVSAVRPGGGTPLARSLQQAFWMLEKQAQRQLGYGEYTVVVVTDGMANQPDLLTEVVKRLLHETPINIFTIGFCIGEKHSLNSAGRTEYRSANNPDELRRGLAEALAETESFDANEFKQD